VLQAANAKVQSHESKAAGHVFSPRTMVLVSIGARDGVVREALYEIV
jgi:hypothetical protein